jgi:hypothetical protein
VPPVSRASLLAGSGSSGSCDGSFAQDFNAVWASKPNLNPGVGTEIDVQLWYRDTHNTSNQTTSLSDDLSFWLNP